MTSAIGRDDIGFCQGYIHPDNTGDNKAGPVCFVAVTVTKDPYFSGLLLLTENRIQRRQAEVARRQLMEAPKTPVTWRFLSCSPS